MVTRRAKDTPVVGVALGATELVACLPADGSSEATRRWRVPLAPAESNDWPALAEAFAALRRAASPAGDAAARVCVALLPPLAEVRMVPLPPVSAEDATRLLSRAIARHFLDVRDPAIVSVVAGDAPADPWVACAVEEWLLRRVHALASATGWTVERVVPAVSAWSGAATVASADHAAVLAVQPTHIELIGYRRGVPRTVRRFRNDASDQAALAEACRALPGPCVLLGEGPRRDAVQRQLQAQGVPTQLSSADLGDALDAAAALVRSDASREPPLTLALHALSARPASSRGMSLTRLVALAGVLGVLGLAGATWFTQRSLAAVRTERATLAPRVTAELAQREGTQALGARMAALAAVETESPRWAALIAELSEALPLDVHATALRARGDTLVLDGVAVRASDALAALAAMTSLHGVSASGPVRRDADESGAALDRFQVTARVAPLRATGAPPSTPQAP